MCLEYHLKNDHSVKYPSNDTIVDTTKIEHNTWYLRELIFMDGSGLYVWSCFFIFIALISLNISLPFILIKKVSKEIKIKNRS